MPRLSFGRPALVGPRGAPLASCSLAWPSRRGRSRRAPLGPSITLAASMPLGLARSFSQGGPVGGAAGPPRPRLSAGLPPPAIPGQKGQASCLPSCNRDWLGQPFPAANVPRSRGELKLAVRTRAAPTPHQRGHHVTGLLLHSSATRPMTFAWGKLVGNHWTG